MTIGAVGVKVGGNAPREGAGSERSRATWPLNGVARGTLAKGSGVLVAVGVSSARVGVKVGVGSRRTNGPNIGGLLRMSRKIKLTRINKKTLLGMPPISSTEELSSRERAFKKNLIFS